MTIEEKRRELFEAAARRDWDKACHDFCRLADGYQNDCTDVAWWAFNAALDAVVIELPAERYVRNGWPEACGAGMAFNDCRELCVDAIESTNLGLKVK